LPRKQPLLPQGAPCFVVVLIPNRAGGMVCHYGSMGSWLQHPSPQAGGTLHHPASFPRFASPSIEHPASSPHNSPRLPPSVATLYRPANKTLREQADMRARHETTSSGACGENLARNTNPAWRDHTFACIAAIQRWQVRARGVREGMCLS